MKILLVNVTYGKGSTGKIVESLYNQYLSDGHDVYCVYGRHSTIKDNKRIIKSGYEIESKFWHALSKISGNLYGGMPLSTNRLKRIIKKINPDIVHLHCLNGFFVNIYSLITFLKKHGIKTVLTNHADFMFTANCGYALECNNWINNECKGCKRVKEFNGKFSLNKTHHFYKRIFKAFHGSENLFVTNVSPWLTKRCLLSPIYETKDKITTVLNPVSIESLNPSQNNPYSKYGINKDTKVVLYVTPNINNPEKGGINILKLADICKQNNYHFFIKSPIKPIFKEKDNITFIDDNTVNIYDLYYYADASLMLSKRETFSMVVAESLCCGTPVVGFKAGGPETIAINDYCSFVENGNLEELKKELDRFLSQKINKDKLMELAKEEYSTKSIANQYLGIYRSI